MNDGIGIRTALVREYIPKYFSRIARNDPVIREIQKEARVWVPRRNIWKDRPIPLAPAHRAICETTTGKRAFWALAQHSGLVLTSERLARAAAGLFSSSSETVELGAAREVRSFLDAYPHDSLARGKMTQLGRLHGFRSRSAYFLTVPVEVAVLSLDHQIPLSKLERFFRDNFGPILEAILRQIMKEKKISSLEQMLTMALYSRLSVVAPFGSKLGPDHPLCKPAIISADPFATTFGPVNISGSFHPYHTYPSKIEAFGYAFRRHMQSN